MAIVLSGEKPLDADAFSIPNKEPESNSMEQTGESGPGAEPLNKDKKTFKLRWYVWVIVGVVVVATIGGSAWYWGWGRRLLGFVGIGEDTTDVLLADGPEEPIITYFENPINGVFIESTEAEALMQNRPLCVMIENHPDARPHSGLASSDMIYEALAEGGITRFMAVIWSDSPERLMPVRSARAYFVKWATDIDGCVFHHIGEAHSGDPNINVRSVVNKYGVLRIGDRAFLRDSECRKTKNQEHCAYSLPETLWAEAAKLGWTEGIENVQAYLFKEESDPVSTSEQTEGITDYSSAKHRFHVRLTKGHTQANYETVWEYDPETNAYLRSHGTLTKSTVHKDALTDKQLSAKNVVIQRTTVRATGDRKNHNDIEIIGSGSAIILIDGNIIQATWSKPDGNTRTKYLDLEGNEIRFNRGQIWVQAMPTTNKVKVETPEGTIVEI